MIEKTLICQFEWQAALATALVLRDVLKSELALSNLGQFASFALLSAYLELRAGILKGNPHLEDHLPHLPVPPEEAA